jgi:cysteine synthase A
VPALFSQAAAAGGAIVKQNFHTTNRYPADLPMTPLVPIQLSADEPVIWCKLEFLNPSGSTKDRIARYILGNAFDRGHLKAGSTVIEASSGSTSIAMAMVSAQLGLRFIAVLPEGVSNERVLMIRAYGGDIHFTPKEGGIVGSIRESERLAAEMGAFLPRQFSNPENVEAHELGTAREIVEQIPGHLVNAVVRQRKEISFTTVISGEDGSCSSIRREMCRASD